ncbi:filamentous hemagglutinin N-terminal domain-containing protein, partial [Billgrantia endophytica]
GSLLAASLLLAGTAHGANLPSGGEIVHGSGTISTPGAQHLRVAQASDKLIANWDSFDIGEGHRVSFDQPGSASVALNRVLGSDASRIMGQLDANGQVFLVNPNGVLFGPNARVDTAGLVASTLDIRDEDFLNGHYRFQADADGNAAEVLNQGTITAHDGGAVALLGGRVSNEGVIQAQLGSVALAAGDAMTLDFAGDGLLSVEIDQPALDALVENRQLIQADGGRVLLTASAADSLLNNVVNQQGIVRARSLETRNGQIVLEGGDSGRVQIAGSLDAGSDTGSGGGIQVSGEHIALSGATLDVSGATGGGSIEIGGGYRGGGDLPHARSATVDATSTLSADATHHGDGGSIVVWSDGETIAQGGFSAKGGTQGGNGGLVETSGKTVRIGDSATISTRAEHGENGTWLIDPMDFTIGAGGDLRGSFISNYLATEGDFEVLSTDGDIVVNDDISWYRNTLTLTSARNILVNGVLTATDEASLVATYGEGTNTSGFYEAAPFGLYTAQGATGEFSGKVDFSGNGTVHMGTATDMKQYHVITSAADFDLMRNDLNNPDARYVLGSDIDFSGLAAFDPIGTGAGLTVRFQGDFNGLGHVLENVNFSQNGVFGYTYGSDISNIGIRNGNLTATGSGIRFHGTLLAGQISDTRLVNAFATGDVAIRTASAIASGGLVGEANTSSLIAASYADVDITNDSGIAVGGLVGQNGAGSLVINSHAMGDISGTAAFVPINMGGFVGRNVGTITQSYATGSVGDEGAWATAGGFAGLNRAGGQIDTAYATGDVTGQTAGGFVGNNELGELSNAYATGNVTGSDFNAQNLARVGGFAGTNAATIHDAYATGSVQGTDSGTAQGFVGVVSGGAISNAYWQDNNGLSDSQAVKLSEAEARDLTNYAGFDSAYWASSSDGRPLLRMMLVYVRRTASLEYGDDDILGKLVFSGLQWGDTAAAFHSDAIDAALLSPYARLNAGVHSASRVLASPAYSTLLGHIAVDPKVVTVTGASVEDKVYDGTLDAIVIGGEIDGIVGEEVSAIFRSASFAHRNVGQGIEVEFDYAFAYGDQETRNYVASSSGTATGNITPKTLTVDYTIADKVYDGGVEASVADWELDGVVSGDLVTIAHTSATFADRNVGQDILVTVEGVLGGGDSGNYLLSTATANGDIVPAALHLSGSLAHGSDMISSADLVVTNLADGDSIALGGSVALPAGEPGLRTLTDLLGLSLEQSGANYTLDGATGTVLVHAPGASAGSGPQGGTVVSGVASISQTGTVTSIHQASDKAIIDWQSFSVPESMLVNFDQPNAAAITLNRVIGNETSIIEGAITANGKVFILNANGVLFGARSQVNVAGLVASSLNLTNEDFDNGHHVFVAEGGDSAVINEGDIVIVDGGHAALIGGNAASSGNIVASGGTIVLAAGEGASLTVDGGLSNLARGSSQGSVAAAGTFDVSSSDAPGGQITFAGEVVRVADATLIDASGPSGDNGSWRVAAAAIEVGGNGSMSGETLSSALAKANVRLESLEHDIDIDDKIDWSSNTLAFHTPGSINVGEELTVTGAGSLTLSHGRSFETLNQYDNAADLIIDPQFEINFNGVKMSFGKDEAGNNDDSFKGKINFDSTGKVLMGEGNDLIEYRVINTAQELDSLRNELTITYEADYGETAYDSRLNSSKQCNYPEGCLEKSLGGYYVLGSDIDLGPLGNWETIDGTLTGALDGFGHMISNLTSDTGGLFERILGGGQTGWEDQATNPGGTLAGNRMLGRARVSNLGLVDAAIDVAEQRVLEIGVLAGRVSSLYNVFTTGTISARQTTPFRDDDLINRNSGSVGGMAGAITGYVDNSYSRVDIVTEGYTRVGGFTGELSADVQNSYATGNVSATNESGVASGVSAGGFAGTLNIGDVKNSYATGNVTGTHYVGGFLGALVNAGISGHVYDSYATGDVHLLDGSLGGAYASLDNLYGHAVGAGGFIGSNGGVVARSHSSGRVTSESGRTELLGGFSGYTAYWEGVFSVNNYWNQETSGLVTEGRGSGVIPDHSGHHGGGGGTPIADALGLTPAQLHHGAHGLTAAEFEHVDDLTSGSKDLDTVREEIANMGDGDAPGTGDGSGPGTSGGGSDPGTGGGSTPVSPANPTTPIGDGGTIADGGLDGRMQVSLTTATQAARQLTPPATGVQRGFEGNSTQALGLLNARIDADGGSTDDTTPASFSANIQQIEVDGVIYDLEIDDCEGPDCEEQEL